MDPEHRSFLLLEYETAAKKHMHHDELSARLNSFFLAFASIASAGVSFWLKKEDSALRFDSPELAAGSLLLLVATIGGLVIATLGEQTRCQAEMNNIMLSLRERFLDGFKNNKPDQPDLMEILNAGSRTDFKVRWFSGKWFWTAGIILVSAAFYGFGAWLLLPHLSIANQFATKHATMLSIAIGLLALPALNKVYFVTADPSHWIQHLVRKRDKNEHLSPKPDIHS